ncbi:ribose-phosphate pyrophosphokinase [Carnobacteriaceae bacterium 52-44]
MEKIEKPKLKLFSLNSNRPLAEKIAGKLGIKLGKVNVTRFDDGEININIEESIRGDDVYVVQSTSYPGNEYLIELLIMIDALKRASAKEINVVIPYYGYARQDRKAKAREPITAKLVANMLEATGADRVLVLDLHAAQLQGYFDIPVDHLLGVPLLASYILDYDFNGEELVIVAPHHGAISRARMMAEFLDVPLAIVDRRGTKGDTVEKVNVIGEVDDKVCIIVDDIIDTANTILIATKALTQEGAKNVFAAATHGVFSDQSIEKIKQANIEKIFVTDSIYIPIEKQINKLVQVTVSELIADAIERIFYNESVSPLFKNKYEGFEKDN